VSYRYLATSPQGFIQQLAVCYLKNHYFFYVMGCVREGKDPLAVDVQILERYGIAMSKWARLRRMRAGAAKVQYLRYERAYLILATAGEHPFLRAEQGVMRDARRTPVHFWGHAIGYYWDRHGVGHPSVRIEREEFRRLQIYFRRVAPNRSRRVLLAELSSLPFELYEPVRGQILSLAEDINEVRKAAGRLPLPKWWRPAGRHPCRPFAPTSAETEERIARWFAFIANG
jgi:hypothetical protein